MLATNPFKLTVIELGHMALYIRHIVELPADDPVLVFAFTPISSSKAIAI